MLTFIRIFKIASFNRTLVYRKCSFTVKESHSNGIGGTQTIERENLVGLNIFTKDHFKDVLNAHPRLSRTGPSAWSSVSGTLFSQGLSHWKINNIFLEAPQVLDLNIDNINKIFELLRNCKLMEQNVLKIVCDHPELLCLDPNFLQTRINDLYGIVTRKDINKILREGQVSILLEPLDLIMEKVYYLSSEMGQDQEQMLKANVFRYSLDFIKMRHRFFLRCGKFKKPNPKVYDHKQVSLKVVIGSDEKLLPKHTGVSIEEYDVFRKVCEEELEMERNDMGYNSDADYNNSL